MLKRFWFSLACLPAVLIAGAAPSLAQTYVPPTVQVDLTKLERQGKVLMEEARQLAQLQQFELALPRVALATQLIPKSEDAWILLGGLQLQAEQVDDGIASLKRAQQLNGKNANVLFALGSAHSQKKDFKQAIAYFRQGLGIKSEKVPGVFFELGNAYLKLGQSGEAVKQFEQAIAQDKKFWPALNNIGLVRYEQGNLEAAIQNWQAASEIDPRETEPKLALAVAFYTKGDRAQGFKLAEQALRLNTKYADLAYLKDQLWGDRLLKDTQKLLETPQMRESLLRTQLDGDDTPQDAPSGKPSQPNLPKP